MRKQEPHDPRYRGSREIPHETFIRLQRSLGTNDQLAHAMATSNELCMLMRVGEGTGGRMVAHLVAATQAGAEGFAAREAWDPKTMREIFALKTRDGVTVRAVVEARLYASALRTVRMAPV